MLLGKLSVPGHTSLDNNRARALAIGGGCMDVFLMSIIAILSTSVWKTARYRLKYSLKGLLKLKITPKQPTSHCVA